MRRIAFGDIWGNSAKLHGESVKVVQSRLAHASASETLDTYSYLWPDSDDRTRAAVEAVLSADSVRTKEVAD